MGAKKKSERIPKKKRMRQMPNPPKPGFSPASLDLSPFRTHEEPVIVETFDAPSTYSIDNHVEDDKVPKFNYSKEYKDTLIWSTGCVIVYLAAMASTAYFVFSKDDERRDRVKITGNDFSKRKKTPDRRLFIESVKPERKYHITNEPIPKKFLRAYNRSPNNYLRKR